MSLAPVEPGRVQRLIEQYRQRVEAEDAAQMQELARRWLQVERQLEAAIELLAREAADLRAQGKPVSRLTLYQMERYRDLLGQARAETLKYQRWAAQEITSRQWAMAQRGVTESQALIRETYLEAGAAVARFNLLPVEAIQAMIGYAGNRTPLLDMLSASYPESVERLTEILIDSTARGINPRQTARSMAEAMSGNLQRALTISRTEQLRAYRTAATQQMRESGVVDGWIWRCALQERTCLACLAMDGTEHSLDEELDDHPNGRCYRQPMVRGLARLDMTSGMAWFETQSAEMQRGMMGDRLYEAYAQGQITFSDLAETRHSEEWGTTVGVRSLEAILQ